MNTEHVCSPIVCAPQLPGGDETQYKQDNRWAKDHPEGSLKFRETCTCEKWRIIRYSVPRGMTAGTWYRKCARCGRSASEEYASKLKDRNAKNPVPAKDRSCLPANHICTAIQPALLQPAYNQILKYSFDTRSYPEHPNGSYLAYEYCSCSAWRVVRHSRTAEGVKQTFGPWYEVCLNCFESTRIRPPRVKRDKTMPRGPRGCKTRSYTVDAALVQAQERAEKAEKALIIAEAKYKRFQSRVLGL